MDFVRVTLLWGTVQDDTQRRCNRVRCSQLFSDTPTCSVPTSSWWITIVEPFWKSGKVGGKCKGLGSRGDSRLHSHWVGSCGGNDAKEEWTRDGGISPSCNFGSKTRSRETWGVRGGRQISWISPNAPVVGQEPPQTMDCSSRSRRSIDVAQLCSFSLLFTSVFSRWWNVVVSYSYFLFGTVGRVCATFVKIFFSPSFQLHCFTKLLLLKCCEFALHNSILDWRSAKWGETLQFIREVLEMLAEINNKGGRWP